MLIYKCFFIFTVFLQYVVLFCVSFVYCLGVINDNNEGLF